MDGGVAIESAIYFTVRVAAAAEPPTIANTWWGPILKSGTMYGRKIGTFRRVWLLQINDTYFGFKFDRQRN